MNTPCLLYVGYRHIYAMINDHTMLAAAPPPVATTLVYALPPVATMLAAALPPVATMLAVAPGLNLAILGYHGGPDRNKGMSIAWQNVCMRTISDGASNNTPQDTKFLRHLPPSTTTESEISPVHIVLLGLNLAILGYHGGPDRKGMSTAWQNVCM
jgi:hypothetical protein